MSEITPTRSALLELMDDRRAMREGYEFLDEKRMLLAGEILRQLKEYEVLMDAFSRLYQEAARALQAAVTRHGLDGMRCYPSADTAPVVLHVVKQRLLGVPLQQAECRGDPGGASLSPNPSPEADGCREFFVEIVRLTARLAALSGNLERLRCEYRRTERRARALEDVLLPEIDETIYSLETRLSEIELNEAIRVRLRK